MKMPLIKPIDLSLLAKAAVTPIRVKRPKQPRYYRKEMRKYRRGYKV